ncbi:hypothetical protein ACFLT8_07560, partial [Chloroflexota bacterium]
RLASEFAVPRFCIVEHGLAIGCHYIAETMIDHEKQDVLRQHLISQHLLDCGRNESVPILTMGERGRAWQLLAITERVKQNVEALERSMHIAKRTGDTYLVDKRKRELESSLLRMAFWIRKHGLGEVEELNGDLKKEDFENDNNN